jgi:hypothetical protein
MPEDPDRAKVHPGVPLVPLFLIPKAIQEQIKKRGESVFSILVERRSRHQYRVRVESFIEHSRRVQREQDKKPDPTVQEVLDL